MQLNGDVSIADKIVHTGDTNTAIRFPAADTITAETGGSERLRIASGGNVGINTDFTGSQTWRNGQRLEIFGGGGNVTGELHLGANRGDSNQSVGSINFFDNSQDSTHRHIALIEADKSGSTSNKRGGDLIFFTKNDNVAAPTEKVRITSGGRLLLNTTTEGNAGADDFTIGQLSGSTGITVRSGTTNNGNLYFSDGTSGDDEYRGSIQYQHANNSIHIATNAVERLIIDSSGRVLVGTTSSSDQNAKIQSVITSGNDVFAGRRFAADAAPAIIRLSKSRNASAEGNTIVQSGDEVGRINFSAADGSDYNDVGYISAVVDGTPGAGTDMPGRLAFFTTPNGSGTPGERLRINEHGQISIRGTTTAFDATGDLDSLQLYYETDSGQASIGPYSSGGSTHLSFYTNLSSAAATEKLRINSYGQIITGGGTGISHNNVGNSDFGSFFEINGTHTINHHGVLGISGRTNTNNARTGLIQFLNTENSNSSSNGSANSRSLAHITVYADTSDDNAGNDSGGRMVFSTKGEAAAMNDLVFLTSDKTVGIQAIPAVGDLNSTATGGAALSDPKLYVYDGGTNGKYNLMIRCSAGSDADNTGSAIALNHSNDRGILIEGGRWSGNRAWGAIKAIDNIGRVTDGIAIRGGNGAGIQDIRLYTGEAVTTTERIRITSAGNLEKKGGGSYYAYNSNNYYAKQDNYDTNGGKSYWYDGGSGNNVIQASIDGQTGNIMSKGNFVVSTAGKGIDFSAQTQSSSTTDDELLDHYEKGKWTPVMKKNGVANATPDIYHGRYVRVGKKVWLSCYMRWNSGSNAQGTSGGWTLHGLPFSIQDDNPGTCRIYQFAPIGYFTIDSDGSIAYGHDSRWQCNNSTYFDLYTDISSSDLAWGSGSMQMSMTGTFMIHE